jgi:AcrR family transcriptional regulator
LKPVALLEVRTGQTGIKARKGSLYRKLKPGPGTSAAEVIASQRARLRQAMVDLVAERGFGGVTVRGLSSTAGVSTRTFYAHFPNAEECFTSTYETVMRTALKQFTASGMTDADRERAIRSGLTSLMRQISENPSAGRLALVESFSAGPAMLREMSCATRDFEQFMLDTFNAAPGRVKLPLPLIQSITAGAERVVRARILTGRDAELPGVSEELADWALSMHDPALATLAIPDSVGTGERRRAARPCATKKPGTAEFAAIGNERGRALAAVIRLSLKDGYWNLTVPRIRREAEVSRRAFDAHFDGVGHCYLEGIEALVARAVARAERKSAGGDSWESRTFQFVSAYCSEVAHSPALAQLGYIDIFAPGQEGLTCRERMISNGAARLRGFADPGEALTELEAEASAAAGWRMIQNEVAAGRAKKLPQVAPLIAFVILAPAVGAARAAEAIHAEQLGGLPPACVEGERAHAIP